jgi:hypothetical protein
MSGSNRKGADRFGVRRQARGSLLGPGDFHRLSCRGTPRRCRLGGAALATVVVLGGLPAPVLGQEQAPIEVLRAEYGDPVLRGAIDLHAHSGPDVRERAITDFDAARIARRAGIRAIVLKHHYSESAHRAEMVMLEVPGIDVYGGVILNLAVGGINPHAIRTMLGMQGDRGRVVWLPTWDAEADASRQRESRLAVPIVEDGRLVPELAEVFQLIAENDLVLATGHISPDEILMVLPAARQAGVRRMLVTHARSSIPEMMQMVEEGAVLECIYSDISLCASRIKAVGAEHFVLATDLGQPGRPNHTDGFKTLIMHMREEGITQEQIDMMVRVTPARLLGLEPW